MKNLVELGFIVVDRFFSEATLQFILSVRQSVPNARGKNRLKSAAIKARPLIFFYPLMLILIFFMLKPNTHKYSKFFSCQISYKPQVLGILKLKNLDNLEANAKQLKKIVT